MMRAFRHVVGWCRSNESVVVAVFSLGVLAVTILITMLMVGRCAVDVSAQTLPLPPVPALYKMFDYGTDYQTLHPEYGAVGSVQWFLWDDVNPARGVYNWSLVDNNLAKEKGLDVTLPDGREVDKPVMLMVVAHLSGPPAGYPAVFYDGTPRWVYEEMGGRPEVGGRLVGHALEGCGQTAVVPAYESATWRDAYYDLVRAMGTRYDDHPQVSAIVVATGLDSETQMVKNWGCDWTALANQVPGLGSGFGKLVEAAMSVYREAFPTTSVYIANAPGGSGMRKWTGGLAADLGVGLKPNAGQVDSDSHRGYGDFWGLWDPPRIYGDQVSVLPETWSGLGGPEVYRWTLYAMLHYHPDALSVHPEYLEQTDPELLRWVGRHLGVTAETSPSAWAVLRDKEYPRVDWGSGGVSGHPGDWTFYLYRKEFPGAVAPRVWREGLPSAKEDFRSRQVRRTDEATGNQWVAFDVDDAFTGADWAVAITILNYGIDTFGIEYADAAGNVRTLAFGKGSGLGPPGGWVEVEAALPDAAMDGRLAGGADWRITSLGDGDEYVHLAVVYRDWDGKTPTPSATRTPTEVTTAAPTRTATATPSATGTPTPTATLAPTVAWFAAEASELNDLQDRVSALETIVAEMAGR